MWDWDVVLCEVALGETGLVGIELFSRMVNQFCKADGMRDFGFWEAQ